MQFMRTARDTCEGLRQAAPQCPAGITAFCASFSSNLHSSSFAIKRFYKTHSLKSLPVNYQTILWGSRWLQPFLADSFAVKD